MAEYDICGRLDRSMCFDYFESSSSEGGVYLWMFWFSFELVDGSMLDMFVYEI